ncbi:DUF2470 domain-containing protein [Lentisphaera profundi]|uniref:DUF2470 domain-containing protein n=1 Tax=Lentisphaera profundi TaxID=1658616 RepID=A0ABY7VYA4_9BACT|nr:DUF2470 domain-containing protein [Lentisphaera profundi]WDE99228.1 DUF2470 domain-containing protein [Lentisphaera profundi]
MSNDNKFTIKAKNGRGLLKAEKDGVLSTHSLDVPGYPFGSVTPYSLDKLGRPVILISEIAQHTKNINADKRVSLTITATSQARDVQANARLTYLADARVITEDEAEAKERYLRKFSHAKHYFQTHDFNFYVLEPVRSRYIEGFGKIWWLENDEIELESVFDYETEARILDHMNDDHRSSLVKYCKDLKLDNAQEDYLMTGIDNEGIDITIAGSKHLRICFDEAITDASQAREVLVQLAK